MIVLYKISKGYFLGRWRFVLLVPVFLVSFQNMHLLIFCIPHQRKDCSWVYYFLNHKMEALAFRHKAWEEGWSALYLTKHSVNKEVISIAITVFLPFTMLIRGEKKSMILLSGNVIYYYLELTGMHGCWWFFAKHRMLSMTKLKWRILKPWQAKILQVTLEETL